MRKLADMSYAVITNDFSVVTNFLHKCQLRREANKKTDEFIAEIPLPAIDKMAGDI